MRYAALLQPFHLRRSTDMKKIFYLLLSWFVCIQIAQAANIDDYGATDKNNVKMSYSFEGGESPYCYARVEIRGTGEATWSFQYIGATSQPQNGTLKLSSQFIDTLIDKFRQVDFLKFSYKDITLSYPEVIDAGTTRIEFQYKENNRKIAFGVVKIDCSKGPCRPINTAAQRLQDISDMFWKVISQEEYLFQLSDYQKKDLGMLADLLSSIGADARDKRILNPDIFVPIMMEIISDEGFRKSVGQYALSALQDIVGRASPPGSEWDYEKWFKWWEVNKTKYETN